MDLGLLRSVRHTAYEKAKKLYEQVVPPPKQSKLQEKGILTPKEFEIAGDALVEACPTWSWESGDKELNNTYLPAEKQFLITKNVPCIERASYVEAYATKIVEENDIQEKEVEEEWIETSSSTEKDEMKVDFEILPTSKLAGNDKSSIPTIGDDGYESTTSAAEKKLVTDMDEVPDISDLSIEEVPVITDNFRSNVGTASGTSAQNTKDMASSSGLQNSEMNSKGDLRTYDVIISYDMMYYVPRCWLIGYDANGKPLSKKEVMEDIMKDYRLKTVTIEGHPHIKQGGNVVSIHPCQHADTMLELMKRQSTETNEESQGKEFNLEQYMILFLKFLSSVIPTIEYDFTYSI